MGFGRGSVIIYAQSIQGVLPGANHTRARFGVVLRSLKESFIPLMMPAIIFGGIFGGVFTAAEAASVASLYAFIVSVFVYKELRRSDLHRILLDTMVLTGVVCLLVGAASCYSWILVAEKVPILLGDFVGWVGGGRLTFLLLSVAIFFFFGMMLDGLPAIIIFFPILLPLAQSLGIHPLHFGVLVIAVVGIAVVAPPVGICLVIICSIAKIRMTETYGPSVAYVLVLIVDLVIMAFWPWLVLFLPPMFRL